MDSAGTDGGGPSAKKAKLEATNPTVALNMTLADGTTAAATPKLLEMSTTLKKKKLAICVGDTSEESSVGQDTLAVPVTAAVLAAVEAFCESGALKDAADLQFETLLQLIKAANFLDIAPMLQATYSHAAAMIKKATSRSTPEALFSDATAVRAPGSPATVEEAAQFLRELASYEPSALAAVQAATIPESEMIAGEHPLIAWKILKDKSAVRRAAEAERLTADIAAAGIKTVKDFSGKLSVNGIKENDIDTAVKLLTYTNQTDADDAACRVIICEITSIEKMSASGVHNSEGEDWGTRSFDSSVAVEGEIFLDGSKSAPMRFFMSVDISQMQRGCHRHGYEVQDETDSVSFKVYDPNNVECDIFNSGSDFDPDEKVADIQQQPARVFGPDKITDKEIRLLTLKEPRECCRNEEADAFVYYEDEANSLLVLLVNACGECVGEDGSDAWDSWINPDFPRIGNL